MRSGKQNLSGGSRRTRMQVMVGGWFPAPVVNNPHIRYFSCWPLDHVYGQVLAQAMWTGRAAGSGPVHSGIDKDPPAAKSDHLLHPASEVLRPPFREGTGNRPNGNPPSGQPMLGSDFGSQPEVEVPNSNTTMTTTNIAAIHQILLSARRL